MEVYVCPLPSCEVRHRVSTAGGRHPLWAPDGASLFYMQRTGSTLMEAEVIEGDRFQRGGVRALFGIQDVRTAGPVRLYDVTSDGQRFVMLRRPVSSDAGELIVVENFFEELSVRVPN